MDESDEGIWFVYHQRAADALGARMTQGCPCVVKGGKSLWLAFESKLPSDGQTPTIALLRRPAFTNRKYYT